MSPARTSVTFRSLAGRCFPLRVVVADLVEYQEREDDRLAALPGSKQITSTLVTKWVLDDRALAAGATIRSSHSGRDAPSIHAREHKLPTP